MNAPLVMTPGLGDTAKFKRFGPFGPAYEVLEVGAHDARIRLLETGEELDYGLDQMRSDIDA